MSKISRRRAIKILAPFLPLASQQCSSPTQLKFANGIPVTIVDLETGAPVSGAIVQIPAPGDFVTGHDGEVNLPLHLYMPFEVTAQEYLVRQTMLTSLANLQVTLWHLADEQERDDILHLLYMSDDGERFPSHRLDTNELVICFDREPTALMVQRYESAAEEVERIFEGTLAVHVTRQRPHATHGVVYTVKIDPTDVQFQIFPNRLAYTNTGDVVQGRLRSGEAIYKSVKDAENPDLVLHETGHKIGFRHRNGNGIVMDPNRYGTAHGRFSLREVRVRKFLYLRRPGVQWQDNDRTALEFPH